MEDDLLGSLRMVTAYPGATDPALDTSATDLRAYLATRDPSLVKGKGDRSLVWFTLRPLTVYDLAAISSQPSHAAMSMHAFQVAVAAVEGLDGDETWQPAAPGTAWRPAHESEDALGKMRAVMSRHDLQWLFGRVGWARILEVGAVALERANAGNGVGGAVSYTVPPLPSPAAATRSARPPAGQTPATSGTPTSAP